MRTCINIYIYDYIHIYVSFFNLCIYIETSSSGVPLEVGWKLLLARPTMKRHFEDDGALQPHRPQKSRRCHSVALSRGSGQEVFLPSHPGSVLWERDAWPLGFRNMSPHCIRSYSVLKVGDWRNCLCDKLFACILDRCACIMRVHPCMHQNGLCTSEALGFLIILDEVLVPAGVTWRPPLT